MLSEWMIREQLTPEYQKKTEIIVKDELSSTNSYLKDLPLEAEKRKICVANKQTATRGRFQRPYFAKENEGIYCSFSFYLPSHKGEQNLPNVTIMAAVAVLEVFQEILPEKEFTLKWVNDVYLEGKKVCGILAESLWESAVDQMKVVVGIGINYTIAAKDFPEELQKRAISLFPIKEEAVDRSVIVGKIVQRFFELLSQQTLDYLEVYRKHSFVLGKKVVYEQNGKIYRGTACEILRDGALWIRLENGEQKALHSGEISLLEY